jgi:hypothetical protein
MSGAYPAFIDKSNGTWRFGVYQGDTNRVGLRMNYKAGDEFESDYITSVDGSSGIVTFTVVYDGSEIRFYEEGVSVHSYTGSITIDTDTSDVSIGAGLESDVYDAQIWDIALTETQINNNLGVELTGDELGLVAYYKFDEGSGDTLTGYANSNDGTINGASWEGTFLNSGYRQSPQIDTSAISEVIMNSISWEGINKDIDSENNVALNKTVTASHPVSHNSLAEVTDGVTSPSDSNTYVGLNSEEPCYVEIDLGQTYNINRVCVWHYYADNRTYYETKTEVSADGVDWYTVYDSEVSGTYQETSSGKEFIFDSREVRYIRDWMNGSTANGGDHWIEIKAFESFKTNILIETSVDNGSTWQQPVNGEDIPNFTSSTNTLDIKQSLSTSDSSITPLLERLEVKINKDYILGYVYDEEDIPVENAEVKCVNSDGDVLLSNTDVEGKYIFNNLESGSYHLVTSYRDTNGKYVSLTNPYSKPE